MSPRPAADLNATIAPTPLGPVEYALLGEGGPVLVLHGSPGGIDQAELMSRFLPRDQFQAIVLSRPGYLGTPLGDARSIDDQADLLVALLDHLEIAKAGVLGWSGSGPTTYRLAATHPDRVLGVVAVDAVSQRFVLPKPELSTRLMFGTRAGEWLMRVLVAHQPKQVVQGTVQSESSLTGDALRQRVEEIFADDTKRQFVLDLAATANQGGDRQAGYQHDLELLAGIDSLELETITRPCLIVQGSADTDVTPDHSIGAAAAIPGAELLMLDGGSHLAFFTHPQSDAAQARAKAMLRRR